MMLLSLLSLIGQTPTDGPPTPTAFEWFAQGEAPLRHDWSAVVQGNPDYNPCYGGAMLACARDADPPEGGFPSTYQAALERGGTFVLWIAATRIDAGSPLSVSLDGSPPIPVRKVEQGSWGPAGVFAWMPVARVGLRAGSHEITVRVTGRRGYDGMFYAYLDALALERVGEDEEVPLAPHPPEVEIGPTLIPFYSGNLSVGWFMSYWGTGPEEATGAIDQAMIDTLKRCSCFSMCDYLAWCRAEPEPGEWDFSFYRANAEVLNAAGLSYNTFAWLHFPPRWFMDTDGYQPYQRVDTGAPMLQQSLWAPATLTLYDEFYRRLAEAMGDRIDFVRIAMPSEYGEIGYATGMTRWLVPDDNAETGYWCGDPYARGDFIDRMTERYGALEALNVAWSTDLTDWSQVAPPADPLALARAAQASPGGDRRRWLDFVDWYQSSWTRFAGAATQIVRHRLPERELILSLGYGGEPVPWGNDQSRHIRMMAEVDASCQSPGDIGYFATRRVSSACRHYGVPYYTEPPGSVDRSREVARIFYDASNGTDTWFDYPQNMDSARDLFAAYKEHLTGLDPVCDVAFILPSAWWWCRQDWHWPQRTLQMANGVRDRMDYEIVDELMIRDGALQNLGIRLAVLCEGDFMERDTLDALAAWVDAGGTLLFMGPSKLADADGRPHDVLTVPPMLSDPLAVAVGQGRLLNLGPEGLDALVDLTYAPGGAARIDGEADGVEATLMPDRILYYNPGPEFRTKRVELRPDDFPQGAPQPTRWEWDLELPAHSIAAIPLE